MVAGDKRCKNFGSFLRVKRRQAGLSQETAALSLGYSERHYLSRIENGRASLPFEKVPAVAKLYQIDLRELTEAVIEEQTRLMRQRMDSIIQASSSAV